MLVKQKSKTSDYVSGGHSSSLNVRSEEAFSVSVLGEKLYDTGEVINRETVRLEPPPLFFEDRKYEIVAGSLNGCGVSIWHTDYRIRNKISRVDNKIDLVGGVVDFSDNIGYSVIKISVEEKTVLEIGIEVFPSMVSYKEDRRSIFADILDEIYCQAQSLLDDNSKKRFSSEANNSSDKVLHNMIEKAVSGFVGNAEYISENPGFTEAAKPVRFRRKNPIANSRKTKDHSMNGLRSRAASDTRNCRILTAVRRKKETNCRSICSKQLILKAVGSLTEFKTRYCMLTGGDSDLISLIDDGIKALRLIVGSPRFRDISDSLDSINYSYVRMTAPECVRLYDSYLILERLLQFNGEVFELPVQKTSLLYDAWCYIKIVGMMKKRFTLVSEDIISADAGGVFLDIPADDTRELLFEDRAARESFILSFAPEQDLFPSSDRDLYSVIFLEKSGTREKFRYLFCPKYRMEYYPESVSADDYSCGPRLYDINSMHIIFDLFVNDRSGSYFNEYFKNVIGVDILFPGTDEEKYRNHRFWKSLETTHIGGLPFLPGNTSLFESFLYDVLIDRSFSSDTTAFADDIAEVPENYEWNVKDVLIGSVRNEEQYRHCLQKNYYYVPARNITEDDLLPVRYVAMALAKSASEPGVRYYGNVVRFSRVKRKIIPFPMNKMNGEEDYFVFVVGTWTSLAIPVLPYDEIVYEPRFTNSFLLKHSEQTYELFNVNSEDQFRLLFMLKRASSVGNEETGRLFKVDKRCSIWSCRGKLEVIGEDETILGSFSIADFKRNPKLVLRIISLKTGIR